MRAYRVNLTGGGDPERLGAVRVSRNFLSDARRSAGPRSGFHRPRRSGPPFVLIGHGLWQRRFGGAEVVGRAISINGEPATIVGVLPAWFRFPQAGRCRPDSAIRRCRKCGVSTS